MFSRIKRFLGNRINEHSEIIERLADLEKKQEYLFWLLAMQQSGKSYDETQREIFLSAPKATGMLRKTQLCNLLILKRIKKICDENKIDFFLYAGTLLGAVRHNGFIPWDDDIDIGMARDQYVRFCELVSTDELINVAKYYNHEGEMYIKAKLRESESFWVDIFLFEYTAAAGTRDEKWQTIMRMNEEYQQLIIKTIDEKGLVGDWSYPHKSDVIDSAIDCYEKDVLKELGAVGNCEDLWFCRSPFTPRWILNQKTQVYNDEVFFPLKRNAIRFENDLYSVINNYDWILSLDYGDYMFFPRKIVGHHLYEQKEANTDAQLIVQKYDLEE